MAIVIPTLNTLHRSDSCKQIPISLQEPGRAMKYTFAGSAKAGMNVIARGIRTKGYRPSKVQRLLRPFEHRFEKGTAIPGPAFNLLLGTQVRCVCNGCYVAAKHQTWNNYDPAPVSFSENEVLSMHNSLLADSASNEVDWGMLVAELGETVGMLLNPLAALRKLFKKTYGRKFLRRKLSDYSSAWLEYRYGIAPLISDFHHILEGNRIKVAGIITRTAVKKTLDRSSTEESLPFGVVGWSDSYIACQRSTTVERTMYGKIYHLPIVDVMTTGLETNNLATIAWELVPFSFVVDWFVGIGDWLSALKVNSNMKYLGNVVTFSRRELVRYYNARARYYPSYAPIIDIPFQTYTVEKESMYRVTNHPPVASLLVNPDLSDFRRQVDSVALSWQQVSRFLRK